MTPTTPRGSVDSAVTATVEHRSGAGNRRDPDSVKHDREARRVILSSYLGSTIEFYDFLLYASASALVFPHIFFTNLDPIAGTIASYGTFAAGYIARPLGGMIFGHFGDRVGRKKMLMISMFIMGIASTLIGLVPPASAIGPMGAVILVILRFSQGIAVGGEWGGAALMALEHSRSGRRGFAAAFTNAGAPSGAALGTFVLGTFAAVLPPEEFLAWGWRIPFLLSFVLLILGLVVRRAVSESPVFQAAVAKAETGEQSRPKIPLFEVLRRPRALVLTMLGAASGFALQVLLSTFSVSFAAEQGAERSHVLYAFAVASVLQIPAVVFFGHLSDRFGRRPVILLGLVVFVLYLFPFFNLLGTQNIWLILVAFTLALGIHAAVYGPLAAFISEQFGTSARYTGASLGYQFATLIGAGFTPTILASLYGSTGGTSLTPVIGFLAGMAIISAVAIYLTGESRDVNLHTHSH